MNPIAHDLWHAVSYLVVLGVLAIGLAYLGTRKFRR